MNSVSIPDKWRHKICDTKSNTTDAGIRFIPFDNLKAPNASCDSELCRENASFKSI